MAEFYWLDLIHLLAAMTWLGGSISVALVIAPALRRRAFAHQRSELMAAMGTRFRVIGWLALSLLVLTGLRRAMLAFGGAPDPWQALTTTPYGKTLIAKIHLVSALLVLQMAHDFVLGPWVRRLAAAGLPVPARARAATVGLAMAGLLLALVIVGLAVALRFR